MAESRIVATKEEQKFYPYAGLFHWIRNSFWTAGQDSWTQPPAQDNDMFMQLTNVEPVVRGVLQRRRGYSLFSNTYTGLLFSHSYSFRSDGLGLRRIVWSSSNRVVATDETGTNVLNPVCTPAPGGFIPLMVLSRLYTPNAY